MIIALLVDKDMMFIGFGLGNDNEHGTNSIHLLSTSSWTWVSDYRPDLSWLARNGPANLVTATTIDDTTTLSDPSLLLLPTTTMTASLSSSLLSPSIINNGNTHGEGDINGIVTSKRIQEPTGNQSNNIPGNAADDMNDGKKIKERTFSCRFFSLIYLMYNTRT